MWLDAKRHAQWVRGDLHEGRDSQGAPWRSRGGAKTSPCVPSRSVQFPEAKAFDLAERNTSSMMAARRSVRVSEARHENSPAFQRRVAGAPVSVSTESRRDD